MMVMCFTIWVRALSEIAWVVKDLGDPQAAKVMDMARDFGAMHR